MKKGMWVWVLCALVATRAHAEVRIGFADAQRVLENSKEGKRVKGVLEEYIKVRQKTIDLEETELKGMEEDLVQKAALLSPEAKKEKQETFQKRMMDFQRKASELSKEVQGKKVEMLKAFNKTLETATQQVAEKEKVDYVFDRSPDGSGLIYAKEAYDLTDKVTDQLDRAAQKAPAPSP